MLGGGGKNSDYVTDMIGSHMIRKLTISSTDRELSVSCQMFRELAGCTLSGQLCLHSGMHICSHWLSRPTCQEAAYTGTTGVKGLKYN